MTAALPIATVAVLVAAAAVEALRLARRSPRTTPELVRLVVASAFLVGIAAGAVAAGFGAGL